MIHFSFADLNDPTAHELFSNLPDYDEFESDLDDSDWNIYLLFSFIFFCYFLLYSFRWVFALGLLLLFDFVWENWLSIIYDLQQFLYMYMMNSNLIC